MTQANELQIDFGSIVGRTAEAADRHRRRRAGPRWSAPASRGPLVCADLLTAGAARAGAGAGRGSCYPAMLANTDQLADLRHRRDRPGQHPGQPDLPRGRAGQHPRADRRSCTRSTTGCASSARKYDPSDPKVRETFDKFMDAVKGLFRQGPRHARDALRGGPLGRAAARPDRRHAGREAAAAQAQRGALRRALQGQRGGDRPADRRHRGDGAGPRRGARRGARRSRSTRPRRTGATGGAPVADHRVHPGDRGAHQRVPAAALRRLVDLAAGAQHPHAQLRPRPAAGAAGQPDHPDHEADHRPVGAAAAGQPGRRHAAGGGRRRQRRALGVRQRVRAPPCRRSPS